ncbi:MAG: two-component system sensor histidine kinase YcbA [Bacillota bacterium]|nr:MAG: two-component system sensor histidine kinase YcbA [Bacillota bacterium]MBS3950260.1 sensor histidine kinase [Peptococcaceae bacterium]
MIKSLKSPTISMLGRSRDLLYLALLTVFVSNFSFYPFGTGFRFSLAVSAFTFYLLMNEEVNPTVGGFVTGIVIILFRAGGNALVLEVPWHDALELHYPAGLFYLLLGSGLALSVKVIREAKLGGILIIVALDAGSNIGELIIRGVFVTRDIFPVLYLLAVVAIMRGTLTGLAYTTWRQRDHIIKQQQRQREFERLLLITSDVTSELLYLENTLTEVERIMLKSYQLYNRLKITYKTEAEAALAIAREIHDAKKDFERLSARLRHVLRRESEDPAVALATLVDVAVKANQALSLQQGKSIIITTELDGQADIEGYHSFLSIFNNLMGNAIEAIPKTGEVCLKVKADEEHLAVTVADTGVGISKDDIPIIFKPGYTTKFNPHTGQASTGLGLAQVKSIVEKLGGTITVTSSVGKGSEFIVSLPLRREA